ncbi:major facilitator superfamily domain-containing protein [Suillus subaureus]|uniref:Major facilitator superfamily domain-containing protein n=1 Tax=Suillus subaureus TaxID=48587 RepID=A0A9P7JGN5_9AGAM|nr:major facilitator superfamily domain-containing protein [Suillus subaureus]KAG1821648.1 major facilitator superfamily domain-containing protein [Suillus subaureus]
MIARQNDEETLLLQRPQQPTTRTPLPWDQLWIILFSQLSDPLSSKTLVPFIPNIGVGRYVGILQSSYYAANALTPVILTALLAISVSMFSFGLSKTFLGLVLSRAVCGAFNGSNSVIKSVVMDIADVTNMPKAYSYMPIPWMIAAIAGPLIGGSFSRPADRFPDIFGRSELLKTYPYILPCFYFDDFFTYFRLKECGNKSVSTRIPPWELIKRGFLGQSYANPRQPSSNVLVNPGEANHGEVQSKPFPLRALLTPKVSTATASYATTGLFHIAFNSVVPVFYATPIELGGLSLDPPRIGAILAASGVVHGIFQLVFYARLHDHFGARAIQITGISSGIPIVILFPVINALARAHGIGLAVWLCVAIQLALTTSLTSCLALFIRAATPNRASLGATNGIAQMFDAGAKIIGPASAASLVYYFLTAVAFLAVGASLLLPRDPSVWEDHQ